MKKYPLFIIIVVTVLLVSLPGFIICIRDKDFTYPAAAVMIQNIKNGNLSELTGISASGEDDPDEAAAEALRRAEELRKQAEEADKTEDGTEEETEEETEEAASKETEEETEAEDSDDEDPENEEDSEDNEDGEDDDDEDDDESEFTTVDDDYFEDACFIGDSRVQGLGLYSGLPATNYGIVSMTIVGVFSKKAIATDIGKVTVPEALALGPQYGKIYMKFGINELGYGTDEKFAEYYYSFIDYVKAVQPDAIIYVMSILHVTESEERKSTTFTNEKINRRNEVIKEVAENEHVYYLDVNEVFTDEYGCMPEEDSFDGIHVKADAIKKWADYLKTHAIVKEEE
ncbi:MAG: hypothetical protein IJT24_02800 [Lachnospiraceae bacterium]|nr:hypothetical protein [Lachnospiraceae bacterium]